MRIKSIYLKLIIAVLVAIFLIAAVLFGIKVWEKERGYFPESDRQGGVVVFNDRSYKYNEDIETLLVMGLDRYDSVSAGSYVNGVRADFLTLFVFNNQTQQSVAIPINRDTMTKVDRLSIGGNAVVGSFTRQIALAYNYADDDNDKIRCRNTKDSVEYLLNGVKVNHYISFTLDAVAVSCDVVGGVDVTLLDDFTNIDETFVKGNKVTLTGEQALSYVRSRYGLEEPTNSARMERQKQYLNALYDKINASADDELILKLVDAVDDYVAYDSTNNKLKQFTEKFDDYEFLGFKEIEGESKAGEEYMEFYPDMESLQKLVIDVFYLPETDDNKQDVSIWN